jgi:alpha-beta hydrolase superfamily lysophospholipase
MSLSFGKFNREFKPIRTEYDWLSRDNSEVDKYISDPFCGGTFTAGFFKDILYGIGEINKKVNIEKIPKDLPIFFISGERDPMGKNTKSVKQAINAFQRAGISKVTSKFYAGARHELLNETNREEVYQDISRWLDECISAQANIFKKS